MSGAWNFEQFLEVDDVVERVGLRLETFIADSELEESPVRLEIRGILSFQIKERVVVLLDFRVAADSFGLLIFSFNFTKIYLHCLI